jgi:hypothetical protein
MGDKVNGTLYGPNGQKYNLNLVWNFWWDGDDFTKFNEIFKLQLTPTGK